MRDKKIETLLLQTAFCCMASDGDIDPREVKMIETLCSESSYFSELDVHSEINRLIEEINSKGKVFIQEYLDELNDLELSKTEEIEILDFAIKTIYADDKVEYSEIKFFKTIRHRLKISDDAIVKAFPDLDSNFIEEDIQTPTFLSDITKDYFESAELPKFDRVELTSKYDSHNLGVMRHNNNNLFGIDVSHYQGDINWRDVKLIHGKHPVDFVFIRATMGESSKDNRYNHNWKKAKETDKSIGAYHYFRPNENGLKQALNFIETVTLTKGDLAPVLDIEEHPKRISMAQLKVELKKWLDTVEAHYGIKPIIYSGDTFFTHFLEQEFKDYKLWIANYNFWVNNPKSHWNIWQFSEKGKVSGISGFVDLNLFVGDALSLEELKLKY